MTLMPLTISSFPDSKDDSLGPNSEISKHFEAFAAGGLDSAAAAAEASYYQKYPNRWSYLRQTYIRDAASEFLGTMVMVM